MAQGQTFFQSPPRAFISYARSDGEDFAAALRARLNREEPELTLWRDRDRMEGGAGWWKQITDAIDQVEILIMVMTPEVLRSDVARREWRYAREKGVRVCPVKGVPGEHFDFKALPKWMSKVHFYDLDKEWGIFVAFLKSPGKGDRVPFMAPDLREDFVERPMEFAGLISRLLDPTRENPVSNTTSIRGSGGFGKTTLAVAICHHPDVVRAFHDGVLWATLGEHPNLQQELTKVYAALSGERPSFVDADDAAIQLAAKLEEKSCLIVIDDVWSPDHVRPFLRGGKTCARLITTRLQPVVTEVGALSVDVNEMTSDESIQLLTAKLPQQPLDLGPFRKLASTLGEWPLLLRLAASQIRERIQRGDTIDGALNYVNRAFEKRGPIAFDRPNDAVAKTVAASLEILLPEDRRRCAELAIFPEDVPIPLTAACALWQLDEFDGEELAQRLDGAALIDFDLKIACLRIHDVLQSHLRKQLPDVDSLHARLVHHGWRDLYRLPDAYAWRWVGWHLARAGGLEQLRSLLLDFRWLKLKLRATDIDALLQDFELHHDTAELRVVYDSLRLASSGLAQDVEQLGAQLKGRLERGRWPAADHLLDQADELVPRPWLTFAHTSLTHPGGALIGILKGHAKGVESVVVSPTGRRALSASADWSVRLWSLDSGRATRVLEGHAGLVHCAAFFGDERRAASGSEDRTVRIWNLERGSTDMVLRGHFGAVTGVALGPGGDVLASVSDDGTARVWDIASGKQKFVHKASSHQLHAIAFTPDGQHILFGAGDWTILMINVHSKAVIGTFDAHSGIVKALAVSRDGRRLLSGSQDETLRLWDLESGSVLHVLDGHTDSVDGVAMDADGLRAVSGSADQTVRVWNLETGSVLNVLGGHSGQVRAVAITPNGGQALSASTDRTVRHWNVESTTPAPGNAHAQDVTFLAIRSDGKRGLSGTRTGALAIWDAESDCIVGELSAGGGHADALTSLRLSSDGQTAVTAALDKSIRVWDVTAGKTVHVLTSHTRAVRSLHASADFARAISLARDQTLRAWDLVKGRLLRVLVAENSDRAPAGQRGGSALLSEMGIGHETDIAPFPIEGDAHVALSPSGRTVVYGSYSRLCSWNLESGVLRSEGVEHFDVVAIAMDARDQLAIAGSRFGVLRVWDVIEGKTLRTLEGHTGEILDVVVTSDGETVISAARDDTIRLWDLRSGRQRMTISCRGGAVDGIAIASRGNYAYAVYGDTMVAFNLATGARIGSLSLDHRISTLALTPAGEELALGDQSGRVHFVRISS